MIIAAHSAADCDGRYKKEKMGRAAKAVQASGRSPLSLVKLLPKKQKAAHLLPQS